jgi:phospholipase/carboxylesterase
MSQQDLVIHNPPAANHLVLLFHGVGSSAANLVPLGKALVSMLPHATIVSVQGPEAVGPGWQWFSVNGVTEVNRPSRVVAAMPSYQEAIRRWQAAGALKAEHTTLIGFSQGGIMALESTQLETPPAARMVALAARFPQPPRRFHAGMRIHLIHGDADAVMPVQLAVDAQEQLNALGAVVSLDRIPGLGHGIDQRMVEAIGRWLTDESFAHF